MVLVLNLSCYAGISISQHIHLNIIATVASIKTFVSFVHLFQLLVHNMNNALSWLHQNSNKLLKDFALGKLRVFLAHL